ncbi:hypothetical protein L1887_59627 [Cichorium endivia]|nr:hypothetical protein L1887_59627 [Cichorium endivia]
MWIAKVPVVVAEAGAVEVEGIDDGHEMGASGDARLYRGRVEVATEEHETLALARGCMLGPVTNAVGWRRWREVGEIGRLTPRLADGLNLGGKLVRADGSAGLFRDNVGMESNASDEGAQMAGIAAERWGRARLSFRVRAEPCPDCVPDASALPMRLRLQRGGVGDFTAWLRLAPLGSTWLHLAEQHQLVAASDPLPPAHSLNTTSEQLVARRAASSASGAGGSSSRRTSSEIDSAHDRLSDAIEGLRQDVEDVKQSVAVVERSGPERFGVTPDELRRRKAFVEECEAEIKALSKVVKQSAPDGRRGGSRFDSVKIDVDGQDEDATEAFEREQQQVSSPPWHPSRSRRSLTDLALTMMPSTQILMSRQDSTLDKIGTTLNSLRNQAGMMGQEIGEQIEIIDAFDGEVEQSQGRLGKAMRKMDERPLIVLPFCHPIPHARTNTAHRSKLSIRALVSSPSKDAAEAAKDCRAAMGCEVLRCTARLGPNATRPLGARHSRSPPSPSLARHLVAISRRAIHPETSL